MAMVKWLFAFFFITPALSCAPISTEFNAAFNNGFLEFETQKYFYPVKDSLKFKQLLEKTPLRKGESYGVNRYNEKLYTFFIGSSPLEVVLLKVNLIDYDETRIEQSCIPLLRSAIKESSGQFTSPFDKTLEPKLNTQITLKGRVFSVREVRNNAIYINFASNFRDTVSGYIPKNAFDALSFTALKKLENKEVLIKGILTKQTGLSIKIENPEQLIVLE